MGRALMEVLFARLQAAVYSRGMLWVLTMDASRFFYEAIGGKRIASLAGWVAVTEVEEWALGGW